MDSDDPGVKASQKYKNLYDIPFIQLKMEKDLSDSVQKEGESKVKEILHPQLKDLIKCQKVQKTTGSYISSPVS